MENKTIQHNDIMDNTIEWLTSKFEETPEGYLKGRAIVTNVGVFSYKDNKGNVIRELRSPEEVFNEDSLQSLLLKPLTNDHPLDKVTTENIKALQVGNIGSVFDRDSYAVSTDIIITDPTAIADVKAGKRSLSCGYTADVVYDSGNWMGVDYDARQTNIRYNHLAIVDNGRAGDLVKIRLDSADENTHYRIDQNKEELKMSNLKMLKLDDGVEYQAEAPVIGALNKLKADCEKLNSDLETFKADKSKLEAERDGAVAKLDVMSKEVETLKKDAEDVSKLDSLVAERVQLLEQAKVIGAEVKADMKKLDIQKAVITKILPSITLDSLKDKDGIYIEAMFDTALQVNSTKVISDDAKKVVGDSGNVEVKADSKTAREKYIDSLKNEYKKGEK